VAEVAPACPASPAEAIIVSSEDESEADNVVTRAASPIVSNLLRAILDTPEVVPSSGAWHAEDGSSEPPRMVLGGGLLGDEIIIE
jgi:hypothetical protein